VAKTPHTRRAVITTAIPNLDPFLGEDVPCLREVQLRCHEDNGELVLNVSSLWRSRDLWKAWSDNVIGLTFLCQVISQKIAAKAKRPVRMGSWMENSFSLHIYGQDFKQVKGDSEKGLKSFFDTFDEEEYVRKSLTSEQAKEMLVLPQLKELLESTKIEQWKFPQKSIDIIESLIKDIESGELMV